MTVHASEAPELRALDRPDGYRLHYQIWRPAGAARASLAVLNGAMSHAGWFQPLAERLLRVGIAVIGADRRGSGHNFAARGDAPSARALLDDAAAILDAERGDAPLHLAGWCWGAALASHLAAELGHRLTNLILLAPGIFPSAAIQARLREQADVRRTSPPDLACLASPIREDMFTAGPYLDGFITTDPLRCQLISPRLHAIMVKLAMTAPVSLAQVRVPILAILADADRATDNAQTERALARLARRPSATVIDHLPGEHALQFDAPDLLARRIAAWIEQPIARPIARPIAPRSPATEDDHHADR